MPIQGIIVVKVFVVAMMTSRMLLSLVLGDLVAPVKLLLEEKDGLVFEAEITEMLVVRHIQVLG